MVIKKLSKKTLRCIIYRGSSIILNKTLVSVGRDFPLHLGSIKKLEALFHWIFVWLKIVFLFTNS